MDGTTGSLPQALLAHSGWARRLARRLVSEGQADDLVQDALVAGLRRPPAADRPLRGWLATVMRNLARNRAAADRRRQQREGAAEDTLAAPTAEEALATVQLHRRLARLVERLPPGERQIVVLHFFEERSSAQIGDVLGVPAATVRWRLGRALDQLRAWLDEESAGSRRRWVLAMAPLLRQGRVSVPALGLGLTLAAGVLVAATVILLPPRLRPDPASARPVPPPPAAPARALPPAPAGRPAPAAIVSASCPEIVAELHDERRNLERDLVQYEDPAVAFEQAPPSPATQQRFAPLVAELLEPDLNGVLECREGICRVLLVRPAGEDWVPVRQSIFDRPWFQHTKPHLARFPAAKLGGITRDPLSGELQQKYGLYLQPPPADPGPVPADPAACERERARMNEVLPGLRQRQQRSLPPPERFRRAWGINKVATAEIRTWLVELAGPRAREVEVECREDVCRVYAGNPQAPWLAEVNSSLKWQTRMGGAYRGPDGAFYQRLRVPRAPTEEEIGRTEFYKKFNAAVTSAIKRCAERHSETDRVMLEILYPGPGELNADGDADRPSLRVDGPAADRPLGQCLRPAVTAALRGLPERSWKAAATSQYSVRGTRPAP